MIRLTLSTLIFMWFAHQAIEHVNFLEMKLRQYEAEQANMKMNVRLVSMNPAFQLPVKVTK